MLFALFILAKTLQNLEQSSALVSSCLYIHGWLSLTYYLWYRAAACDVTVGVASLYFDATELQIFKDNLGSPSNPNL